MIPTTLSGVSSGRAERDSRQPSHAVSVDDETRPAKGECQDGIGTAALEQTLIDADHGAFLLEGRVTQA